MRDIALDPLTGDISLSAGGLRLTSGTEAVAQKLRVRLGLWFGEYVLDRSIGIPYQSLLGTKDTAAKPGGPARLERTLRRAAATCPGVASLTTFSFVLNSDRRAVITLVARSISGEIVTINDFVAGAL